MSNTRPRASFNPDLNPRKLEQVILFFLHHANNEHLGKVKLMKMLYYADFDHYEQYEQPLTGARYRKLDHGPVPDDAFDALDDLARAERIVCRDVNRGGYVQHRCETTEPLDLSVFSQTEIDTLHQVARRWSNHTTKQIEAATHGEAPWIAAKLYDEIPYYLAHYRNNFGAMELDEDEVVLDHVPDEDEVFAS